ncbi:hypothetical protein M5D96_005088 [Drosophila gunungcola]|uniref:Uncharacterized protein n=1 Tax=Drosophila gunungcola TaxID=103775 RepID=A0A9P9YV65_9MUSC|nr:hypothetical protein M5D96_005088 [Drosophila gunungcola]
MRLIYLSLLVTVLLIICFTNGAKVVRFRRATEKPLLTSFEVKKCPVVKTLKNVDKTRVRNKDRPQENKH